MEGYDKHYSDDLFWDKLKHYALLISREAVEKALLLYFCLNDLDTPAQTKSITAGSLGYLIFPMDAIPDLVPLVGYADDIGALTLAVTIAATHIKDEHIAEAKATVRRFFGRDYGPEANA